METSALEKIYLFGLGLHRKFNPPKTLPYPVISVGNIALGGRAKTPLVIEICRWLKNKNYHPVVLTRGYGRQSKKAITVLRNSLPDLASISGATAAQLGDEACEIFASDCSTLLVGSKRYKLAKQFLAHQKPDRYVFVLDDGFQHWGIRRNFDLVLIKEGDLTSRCLPLGWLREPASALKRAHMVFCQGVDFRKITKLKSQPTASALILTTRAPNTDYFNEIAKQCSQTLTNCALSDHASRDKVLSEIGRATESELIVGAKEASKLLSYNDFKAFINDGKSLLQLNGRSWKLHFVECDIEFANTKTLWSALDETLERMDHDKLDR